MLFSKESAIIIVIILFFFYVHQKTLAPASANCSQGEWQCLDRLCIPEEWVCNGDLDCLDGSDETLGCTKSLPCDGFKCENGHCIPKEWRCDKNDDCGDNSDETGCGKLKFLSLKIQKISKFSMD